MKENNQNSLGSLPNRLRQLRKYENQDWSQGQVAKKVGVEAQRISQYERGLASPPLEMIEKIANVYEVGIDFLIKGESFSSSSVHNEELLERLKELEKLPDNYQKTLISVLDSFIMRNKFEELTRSK